VTGWTTREAAEKCGLTQYTLRWYERIGLLDRVERTADGRRRFSDADLDWLMLLCKLRATSMPVRDMLSYAELVRSAGADRTAAGAPRTGPPGRGGTAGMPEAARRQDRELLQHPRCGRTRIGETDVRKVHWANSRSRRRAWAAWG
jgi:DNA-binding transcriptional MerR regulator